MAPKKSKGSKRQVDAPPAGYSPNLKKDPVKDPFNVRTVLEQHQVSREEYEERFFWNEGELKFSNVKIVPTQEEIEHGRKVIAKIEKKS
jgi:hypothetical protein